MTLRDIFQAVADNPSFLLFYLLLIPMLTFLVGIWLNDNQQAYQIRWFYTVMAYLAAVPGIFALTLNIYLFLFERQSIWSMNLVTQVLPIVSMFFTLFFIKQKLPFEYVPGFEKLTGFLTIMAAAMGIMWFIDRMHIVAITFIPFQYIAIGFLILLLLIRFGWKKMF